MLNMNNIHLNSSIYHLINYNKIDYFFKSNKININSSFFTKTVEINSDK